MTVFDRLCRLLDDHPVPYSVLEHAPVYTSAEAAAVRGTTLASGAKALICKADESFVMIVMPADCKSASKRVRQTRNWKSLRFATADEVQQLTSLVPGSIPPFGSLFQLPTLCDQRLSEQPQINFNAGDHARSVTMSFTAYEAVERPEQGDFSDPAS